MLVKAIAGPVPSAFVPRNSAVVIRSTAPVFETGGPMCSGRCFKVLGSVKGIRTRSGYSYSGLFVVAKRSVTCHVIRPPAAWQGPIKSETSPKAGLLKLPVSSHEGPFRAFMHRKAGTPNQLKGSSK